MKTIVLACQKGGAGKTTLSTHLAVQAVLDGKKVVTIDMDTQASLSHWWEQREAEFPSLAKTSLNSLKEKIEELKAHDYDYLFIDTPPNVSADIKKAVAVADLVLIPVKPSPNDLRAVGGTIEIVKGCSKPFVFVISQAKQNANITGEAIATLSAFGEVAPSIIGDRVDFAVSMIDGRSVNELDSNGRSAQEIAKLYKYVNDRIADVKNGRKTKSHI